MKGAFLVAWSLVAVVACLRLDPIHRPLVADNQLYFYLAERAASGTPPHVSHVDTKSQLGVLTTAAAIRAGRVLGADDVLSSRVVSIAAFALALPLAAELGAVLTGSALAGHATAAALLGARSLAEHAASGNNVKVFLLMFALAAHLALAKRRDALAGLCAGAAFLCWQPGLLVVGAVGLEALLARDGSLRRTGSLRRAATVAAGASAAVCGYEFYFFAHGALAAQWQQEFVMTLGSIHTPRRLLVSLRFLLHEGRDASAGMRILPLSFALVAVVAVGRWLLAPRQSAQQLCASTGWISCAVAGLGAAAFTVYDHQGVPDLFFPDPYFALSVAVVAAFVLAQAQRWGGTRGGWFAAVGLAAVLAIPVLRGTPRRPPLAFDLEDQRRLAAVLRGHSERGGDVWVYGAVHLLGLAHLDNHVPYGLFYDDVRSVLDVEAYRPLRDGRMPQLVVQMRGEIPGASEYLASEYVEETPVEFRKQGLKVWWRVGC